MKVLCFILLFSGCALGTVINNVRVLGHIEYIIEVLTETVKVVEEREWCNLKLPNFTVDVDEAVLDWHASGPVHYTNGFVVSIQQVDIQQNTVQQVWTFNNTDQTATVSLRGTLRLHDLAIGYDVAADFQDGSRRYTAIYSHPLISLAFSINRNIHLHTTEVTVVGTVPRVTSVRPEILPKDYQSDALTTIFDSADTADGIITLGHDVFAPITLNIVTNQVQFPTMCYNCPA